MTDPDPETHDEDAILDETDSEDVRSGMLKRCPFCGSGSVEADGWASAESHGPACDGCGGSAGNATDTPEQNIAAWNRRTPLHHGALTPFPSSGDRAEGMQEDWVPVQRSALEIAAAALGREGHTVTEAALRAALASSGGGEMERPVHWECNSCDADPFANLDTPDICPSCGASSGYTLTLSPTPPVAASEAPSKPVP